MKIPKKPSERKADRITWISMAAIVVIGAAGMWPISVIIFIVALGLIVWTDE